MSEPVAIIATLASVIVSLVGVIIWAVRFTLSRILGPGGAWDRLLDKMDKLDAGLRENTQCTRALGQTVKEMQIRVESTLPGR